MLPDLTGYKLNKALNILNSRGIKNIYVSMTTQPNEKDREINPESRVVRMTEDHDNRINILVCS